MKLHRGVIAAGTLVLASLGLGACHKPPDVACQFFARSGYQVLAAWWDPEYSAYRCRTIRPSTADIDWYWVLEYPGERYIRVD